MGAAGRGRRPPRIEAARPELLSPDVPATPVPPAFHVAAAVFVAAALAYAWLTTWRSALLANEDGFLEWWTVLLFGAAGVTALVRAVRRRHVFDLLIALFCLFVAGEEMSWGQRLLGLTPPEYFLQNNGQQEINLHNMVRPRKFFSMALAGFGVLMPLAWRWRAARPLMRRIGATPPDLALLPWVLVAIVLTQWDPQKLTSEWAECLAGAVFLVWAKSMRPAAHRWRTPVVTVVGALGLTGASSWRGTSDAAAVACAERELQTLVASIAAGPDRGRLLAAPTRGPVRLWTAVQRGDLSAGVVRALDQVACTGSTTDHATRRRFAVDPWGLSYHYVVRDETGTRRLMLISFGPNRRVDGVAGRAAGDDVVSATSQALVAQP